MALMGLAEDDARRWLGSEERHVTTRTPGA